MLRYRRQGYTTVHLTWIYAMGLCYCIVVSALFSCWSYLPNKDPVLIQGLCAAKMGSFWKTANACAPLIAD